MSPLLESRDNDTQVLVEGGIHLASLKFHVNNNYNKCVRGLLLRLMLLKFIHILIYLAWLLFVIYFEIGIYTVAQVVLKLAA